MDNSAFDIPALLLTIVVAAIIAAALVYAHRDGNNRRGWIVAGVLTLVFSAIGALDLLRSSPRETHFTTVIVGVALPVLGALGMIHGTRRVRPWVRWLLTFVTALVLLIGGLQLGATVAARFLPF